MSTRKASHAGDWYFSVVKSLDKQLGNWLSAAELSHGPARAIIAPHAGYTYCGACSAFAYRQISPVVVRKIFILGPSHHVHLPGCALSSAVCYETPLYNLNIDNEIYKELEDTGHFERMSLKVDEDEHSIEMMLPFVAKVMEDYKYNFTIVPVLVGALNFEREELYGKIFAKYLADPQNLFVISSDFCHWGKRFRYTYVDKQHQEIYQSIEHLDRMGMDAIETLDPTNFNQYLKTYSNTICGRHPIGVLLQAVQHLRNTSKDGTQMKMKFIKYAQSNQCKHMGDSSVSYASASLVFE